MERAIFIPKSNEVFDIIKPSSFQISVRKTPKFHISEFYKIFFQPKHRFIIQSTNEY